MLVIAHRGASRAEPENTIAAFVRALAMGADGVELDARRTADGVLVVHHDPVAAGIGLLADQPFAEVRRARPDIPTLTEALDACRAVLVNVEIKCLPWEPDADDDDRTVVRAVVDLVRGRNVLVSSFDLGAVDACRAFAPEIPTAWLTQGQEIAAAGVIAHEHSHAWLHPDRDAALRASTHDIAAVHALGVKIDVWTVDDPDEIRTLRDKGIDAIVTNVPDVALGNHDR